MPNISEHECGSLVPKGSKTMLFLKNASQSYIFSNQAHTQMCGAKNAKDIIGRRTGDFFEPALTSRYANMDQDVLEGQEYQGRFDVLPDVKGNLIWTLFNRTQVKSKTGERLIMGLSKQLPRFRNSDKVYQRLQHGTEYLSENFKNNLSLKALAETTNCSMSQIERDFANVLKMTPTAYQARLKINYIKSQLTAGLPLAYIALDAGFAEQSTLSRFFKKHTDMTLQDYRRIASIG